VAGVVALARATIRYWRMKRERERGEGGAGGDLEAGGGELVLSAGELARAEALVRAVGGGRGREEVALATIRSLRAGGLSPGRVDAAPVTSGASGSAGIGRGGMARRVGSGEGGEGEGGE
jgi:hypothetical protein